MNLNELITDVEMSGWKIKVEKTTICLACFVEGGEIAYMGHVINESDKMIYINNVEIVEDGKCDFVMDHGDMMVEKVLANLIELGKVEIVIEDGEKKYRAIK
jgi:hypothetical protein